MYVATIYTVILVRCNFYGFNFFTLCFMNYCMLYKYFKNSKLLILQMVNLEITCENCKINVSVAQYVTFDVRIFVSLQ